MPDAFGRKHHTRYLADSIHDTADINTSMVWIVKVHTSLATCIQKIQKVERTTKSNRRYWKALRYETTSNFRRNKPFRKPTFSRYALARMMRRITIWIADIAVVHHASGTFHCCCILQHISKRVRRMFTILIEFFCEKYSAVSSVEKETDREREK